jgi:hypothetical protein
LFDRYQRGTHEGSRTGIVIPLRGRRGATTTGIARRRDDEAPAAGGSAPARRELLGEEELRAIEGVYADGITAVQIVEVFTTRGIKFSEASFRKYVQQGLLPRSKRVGRKGKHRGSLGVYPAKTIRRINHVKQLMAEGHTIEEIQGQFLLYTDLAEGVGEHLSELMSRLAADIAKLEPATRKALDKELAEARRDGDRLVERLNELTRKVAAPGTSRLRLAGAAGGAEDLL